MPERRDPAVRALIVELAESSPIAPVLKLDEPRAVSVRPTPSTRRALPAWATMAVAAAAVIVLLGGALLAARWVWDGEPAVTGTTVPSAATTVPAATTIPPTTAVPPTTQPVTTTEATTTTTTTPPATTIPVTPARLEVTWQQAPLQPAFGLDDYIWSVIEFGPRLVAVGGATDSYGYADAAVWASADSLTWERVGDPEVFGGVPTPLGTDRNQVITDVAAGPSGLVAVGGVDTSTGDTDPPIWISPDGITWSRLTGNQDAFPEGTWITAVTAGGPGYVAVGSDGFGGDAAAWVSADGRTWAKVGQELGEGYGSSVIEDVTLTDSGLVAVGTAESDGWYFGVGRPVVWTSHNGLTWDRTELGSEPAALWAVLPVGEAAIAVGYTEDASTVWMSEGDSGGWSAPLPVVSRDAELWFWSGLAFEDRLLVVGVGYAEFPGGEYPFPGSLDAAAWASDDGGTTWYESTSDPEEGVFSSTSDQRPPGFRDVIRFGDGLLAVGGTGNGSAPIWIGNWGEE